MDAVDLTDVEAPEDLALPSDPEGDAPTPVDPEPVGDADKPKAKKATKSDYVVLQGEEVNGEVTFKKVYAGEAANQEGAQRAAYEQLFGDTDGEQEPVILVAIPTRSWNPKTLRMKRVSRTTIAVED